MASPRGMNDAHQQTIVPISITMPCIVSFSTLARKPPNAVYSAMLMPKISRPVS
jgi:hypothetical protein